MADEGHSLTSPDSEFGRTPLYYASLCGRLPAIQFLIDVCYKGLEVSISCIVAVQFLNHYCYTRNSNVKQRTVRRYWH
jgi:hypothetical protein